MKSNPTQRRPQVFSRIIQVVTTKPKRVIALWVVVALALANLGGALGYKAITDDTAQFLPKGSESAQATRYARTAFGEQAGTRTVSLLVKRVDGSGLDG